MSIRSLLMICVCCVLSVSHQSSAWAEEPVSATDCLFDSAIIAAQGYISFDHRGIIRVGVNGLNLEDMHWPDSLREISLSSVTFGPLCAERIGKIPQLTVLDISDSEIGDEEILSAARSKSLHTLQVSNTNLSGDGVNQICRSDLNLSYLALDVSSDEDIRDIGRLQSLIGLYLSGAKLTDAALPHISELGNLSELSLRDSEITAIGFDRAKFDNLHLLDLSGTQINDRTVKFLTQLPELKSLSINNTQVGDAGLKVLANAPKLDRISAVGSKITQQAAEAFAGGPRKLRVEIKAAVTVEEK